MGYMMGPSEYTHRVQKKVPDRVVKQLHDDRAITDFAG